MTASTDEIFGIRVKWGFDPSSTDTAYVELQQTPDADGRPIEENASLLSLIPYPQHEYWHSILPGGFTNWYRARTVDRIGNVSPWTDFVRGQASINVDDILGDILDDILNSPEFEDFKENATISANKIKYQAQAIIQNALATDADLKWTRKENGKRKAEYGQAVQLIADETQARVTAIEELRATINDDIGASIKEVKDAIATEEEARAQAVQSLETKFNKEIEGVKQETAASIGQVNQAVSNESEARAQAVQSLDAKFTRQIGELDKVIEQEVSANISKVEQAIANEAEARASADNVLSARMGNAEAAIAQKVDSWANAGGAGARYEMKLGLTYNGVNYSAGMFMGLVADGAGIRSQVLFDAGRFGILSSAGGGYTLPFVVENGQVIMNSAIIKHGSITNAMIGGDIRSNTYVWNQAGWRLDKNGIFENYGGGAPGQGAMKQTNDQITVRDANGVVRVQIGRITGVW